MAANTISQNTSFVQDSNLIRVDFLNENTPVVSSLDVARHFQRKHKHVLDEIRKIQSIVPKEFFGPNFRPIEIKTSVGFGIRKDPAYQLTRDAFSLLVMGFTGSAAIRWKLRYIEAFNALEQAVLEKHTELALEVGRCQGLDEATPQRLQTARLVWKLGPAKKRRLRAVLRYRSMGLGVQSIAKLLDCHGREVSTLLKAADALGWLPPAASRPVQGNLLEVGHEQ